jgi:hypothetical protein
LHQRFQSLLGGGIAEIVQRYKSKLIFDHSDVLLGLDHPGLVRIVHDARHHHSGQNAENHHHHHHFDQGEAARAGDRIIPAVARG